MDTGEWLTRWEALDPWRREISALFEEAEETGQYNKADEMSADLKEEEAALAEAAYDIIDRLAEAHYACAECGTTENGTYVVTILDQDNPHQERTEVCLACHEAEGGLT